MTTVSISKYMDVEVDVDLGDFETKDLQDELAKRNAGIADTALTLGEDPHPLTEIYYAFKFGLDERATQLARQFVCDTLGVVL